MSDPDPYGPMGETPRDPSPPAHRIPRDVLSGGVPHERFEQRKRAEQRADARMRRYSVAIRRRGEAPTPGVPSIAGWQFALIVVLVPLGAVFALGLLDHAGVLGALVGTLAFALLVAAAIGIGAAWAALRRRRRR